MPNRFIAYYRVSTDRQSKSGLGLEAQRRAVLDHLAGCDHALIEEFTEVESGSHSQRPKLSEAIRAAKRSRATLIIAKLDRLARNVAFIANLLESGIEFVAVDMPMANKLTIHILAAVAEHEREMISERTRAALAAAKARGTRLGNPTSMGLARRNSASVREAAAQQFACNVGPIIRQIEGAGASSLRQIAVALNTRGIPSARGGAWQVTQVKRVLERASCRAGDDDRGLCNGAVLPCGSFVSAL